jgi:hypothetical protein
LIWSIVFVIVFVIVPVPAKTLVTSKLNGADDRITIHWSVILVRS